MTNIAPAASGPPPSTTASTIAGAQQSLAGDQNTFLKLLTAQLKNQDPLSPVDPNQFTQQLVAMTGVQQQIVTNELLQKLVNNQGSFSDPVALIGKTVTVSGAGAALQGGKASWVYSLAGAAAGVTLKVLNSGGNVVWQGDAGALPAGEHAFTWNGKDLFGAQRPDGGAYTLQVDAAGAAAATVASEIFQRGLATSIQQNNGSPLVGVNGANLPLSSIVSVGTAP